MVNFVTPRYSAKRWFEKFCKMYRKGTVSDCKYLNLPVKQQLKISANWNINDMLGICSVRGWRMAGCTGLLVKWNVTLKMMIMILVMMTMMMMMFRGRIEHGSSLHVMSSRDHKTRNSLPKLGLSSVQKVSRLDTDWPKFELETSFDWCNITVHRKPLHHGASVTQEIMHEYWSFQSKIPLVNVKKAAVLFQFFA